MYDYRLVIMVERLVYLDKEVRLYIYIKRSLLRMERLKVRGIYTFMNTQHF